MTKNNNTPKHYLVSVALASLWGFLGAKELYNGNLALGLARLSTAVIAAVTYLLGSTGVIPAVVPTALVIGLCVWSIIDSLVTYSASNKNIKEQKTKASQTDKNFAKAALVIGISMSVFIGIYATSPTIKSYQQDQAMPAIREQQKENYDKFTKIKLLSNLDAVELVMGSKPDSCTDIKEQIDPSTMEPYEEFFCKYATMTGVNIDQYASEDNTSISLQFVKKNNDSEFTLRNKESSNLL